MGKVPRRKRLKHCKSHRVMKNERTLSQTSSPEISIDSSECSSTLSPENDSRRCLASVSGKQDECESSQPSINLSLDCSLLCHDYSRPPDENIAPEPGTGQAKVINLHGDAHLLKQSFKNQQRQKKPQLYPVSTLNSLEIGQEIEVGTAAHLSGKTSLNILLKVKEKLELFMFKGWVPVVHHNAVQVLVFSPHSTVCIQRCVTFLPSGKVRLTVHSTEVCSDPYFENVDPHIPLQLDTVNYFVDRCVSILKNINCMEICGGFDDEKYQHVWSSCPNGVVDRNCFKESRYVETLRSVNCKMLVKGHIWRCNECVKLYGPLKRKHVSVALEKVPINTANKFLTEEQKLMKLQSQRRDLDCANKKIARLSKKIFKLVQKEGIQVTDEMSTDLTKILKDNEITPAQSIFLQQQVRASQQKNMVGMRWHPTMIRLALSMYITSPAAYEMLRDTGMVRLPCGRTLFDYLHVKPVDDGIDKVVLDSVADRVQNFKERHKKFHVLMADEVHISQNLVHQKSTGKLIGYVNLHAVDEEVKVLESYLDDPDKEAEPTIASKVMTYMVKGVSNGIKEVVASYAVGNMSANQMYLWTWEVIGALERSGVQIVAFVCDGCSTNRAFIKKHKPVTVLSSGVIYDTINKAAPDRVLYFISDVPHLLKTVRNCLMSSRSGKLKGGRKMRKGGKKISWDFIVRLYHLKKGKSLRKAFKLSPMNVFPDSYARMKVKYAAQVLSLTVALALEHEGWADATETVKFLRLFNDWFDTLNGAHSSMGQRKRNPNLNPYTSMDDPRFEFLHSFLKYLEDWKIDASSSNCTVNSSFAGSTTGNLPDDGQDESIMNVEEEDDDAEEETPASRRLLSHQTLLGLEMTTLSFIDLVKFLLLEGTSFVNARIFSQDPLEQHFSKVRAGQGGSSNPNLGQVRNRNRALHTIGQMGMKRKKGNTECSASSVQVTTDRLPKRPCIRVPKFAANNEF